MKKLTLILAVFGLAIGCSGSLGLDKKKQSKAIPFVPVVPTYTSEKGATSNSAMVIASEGGQIQLGDEAYLTIPPDSLTEDTVITIEKESQSIASGDVHAVGSTYRFSPEGLEFAPGKPAALTVKYISSMAPGTDPATTALYYKDESTGELTQVASVPVGGNMVTAVMEHFSQWIPGALATPPGTAIAYAFQAPSTPVINAPLFVRASVGPCDRRQDGRQCPALCQKPEE